MDFYVSCKSSLIPTTGKVLQNSLDITQWIVCKFSRKQVEFFN